MKIVPLSTAPTFPKGYAAAEALRMQQNDIKEYVIEFECLES
jgi:hypothetical protein